MAKVIIAGNAYVVKSEVTTKKIEELAKYKPEALCLFNENKEPVFAVTLAKRGAGSVGSMGVVFPSTTNDPEGKACFTGMIPEGVADAKEWVKDEVGYAVLKLTELESTFAGALESVAEYKQKLDQAVTAM